MLAQADPAHLQQLPAWSGWLIAWLHRSQFFTPLLLLMLMDFATGVFLALGRKTLSSSVSWRGAAKKATALIIIGMCAVIEPFANGVPLVGPVVLYFLVTECISILEHAGALGVPLPPFLLDSLEKLRQQKAIKNMPIAAPGSVIVNPGETQSLKVEAHVSVDQPAPPKAR